MTPIRSFIMATAFRARVAATPAVIVLAAALAAGCSGDRSHADHTEDAPADPAEIVHGAVPDAAPAGIAAEETHEGLRTLPVTIYQRAPSDDFGIIRASARIVWIDAPVERARQLVQLVLDGVPDGASIAPVPAGSTYREVYIDDRGIAWVDLAATTAARVAGSDEEQGLVACLTMTLVENMDEVSRVGILIDGESRTTLAGHVDLTRVFDGQEWLVALDLSGDASVYVPSAQEADGENGRSGG